MVWVCLESQLVPIYMLWAYPMQNLVLGGCVENTLQLMKLQYGSKFFLQQDKKPILMLQFITLKLET